MKVVILFTCFNRKNKTLECINSIVRGNPKIDISFLVVDDNSNDGTYELLQSLSLKNKINVIRTEGNLYYSGGMRRGMEYLIKSNSKNYDYLLMINDDVNFYENYIYKLITKSKKLDNAVIVGATENSRKEISYGAIKYNNKSIKYKKIDINEKDLQCDTFNANCVLIPYSIFKKIGSFDPKFVHSLGDFDYGLTIKRNGYKIFSSDEFIGFCENNSINNTWMDKNISIYKRIKLKENAKGAPFKLWYYFLKKNFGIILAIRYSISPYIRIFLKK